MPPEPPAPDAASIASADSAAKLPPSRARRILARARRSARVVVEHAVTHTGVGIVCAVAYFDPGNWGVDLQAGSQYGYKLLFVVLLAGIFAVFLQILASRLGCVTGLDLAAHCRLLLHSRTKHTLLYRWALLYPLYVLSEVAIIATDLAELLGSAIALTLLFPKLPLWAGVLITASDVFVLLALKDPLGGKPVRIFEIVIGALVFTVLVCMAIIISQVDVNWGKAFDGFVPSDSIFKSGALYISIGIIGATVMPHSIFLGSALATQDRISKPDKLTRIDTVDTGTTLAPRTIKSRLTPPPPHELLRRFKKGFRNVFRIVPIGELPTDPKSHAEHENNTYTFVRAHIYHGMIDIAVSLLCIAVVINAMILILASAVFYYGAGRGSGGPASLFDAYDLLKQIVGQGAATLFALALLASGQSSSIIATMAGQVVSEGFLRWRVSPVFRRGLTRAIGLVPSMAVALAAGRSGVDTMLVASQVVLSIVLPFIVFPLLYLTNSRAVMTVKKLPPEDTVDMLGLDKDADEDREQAPDEDEDLQEEEPDKVFVAAPQLPVETFASPGASSSKDVEAAVETVSFANNLVVAVIGWIIWVVVVAANVYAIVALCMGQS
ncbi:Nramp-domain-containing protein [Phanerochaete sordida]|uniref:Nramp-domain-containing protein n=1 Tax=Phanerochaete sordida TaxID=48140 RepID=A0A292G6A1_9APHY|nr:putative natural resistance associated macrophage protein family transporter [Phanerochaete sordida]GJE97814.1 Nramp-domain-containing protein [Phanerochaete sordida]